MRERDREREKERRSERDLAKKTKKKEEKYVSGTGDVHVLDVKTKLVIPQNQISKCTCTWNGCKNVSSRYFAVARKKKPF